MSHVLPRRRAPAPCSDWCFNTAGYTPKYFQTDAYFQGSASQWWVARYSLPQLSSQFSGGDPLGADYREIPFTFQVTTPFTWTTIVVPIPAAAQAVMSNLPAPMVTCMILLPMWPPGGTAMAGINTTFSTSSLIYLDNTFINGTLAPQSGSTTPSPSASQSALPTPGSVTATSSASATPFATPTSTSTGTRTGTPSVSHTRTSTKSISTTASATATATSTASQSSSPSASLSLGASPTPTPTATTSYGSTLVSLYAWDYEGMPLGSQDNAQR